MAINNAVNAKVTGFQSLNSTTGVWNGRTLQQGTGITITNADGTGGDPTITATSAPPDSAFGTVVLVDDFLHSVSGGTTGDTGWLGTLSTGSIVAGEAGHPGIWPVDANNTLIKSGGVNGSAFLILANGEVTFETVMRVDVADSGGLWLGLMDTVSTGTGTEPVNGAYFAYDSDLNSGKWIAKTSAASVRTSANSNNTVGIGTWVRLKIVVNAAATSISFFVDGVEITNSPITTNIPTVAMNLGFTASNHGTDPRMSVDLVTLKYVLTTPR